MGELSSVPVSMVGVEDGEMPLSRAPEGGRT
jgi:hypothetical protein